MKKHIFTALLLAAVSTLAQAQAINPTVEVTNVFDGKLLDIHKPAREMDVPDSLMNFDLKFDYSVFDNPYKGVYEFKPYLVDMTPAPDGFDGRRIYLRTGAGYALNPVFDFVWSPFGSGPFTLNVYASHQSYIGKYRRVFASPKSDEDNTIRLVSNHEKAKFSTDEEDIKGYDISNKAGVNGRFQWDSGELDFKAGYYGLNSSVYDKSNYNAGDVAFGVRSKDLGGSYMYYDANLAYRYGTDDVLFDAKGNYRTLDMQDIRFFGTFGPVIGGSNRLLIDASMGMTFYSGLFKTSTGNFNFTPRYVLDLDRINLSLGVKVSMSINNKNVTYGGFVVNPDKGQLVYPAVHADVAVVPDWLDVYASVTGGDSLNDYSSLKDANHFFHADYGRGYGPFSDLTTERVNARLGFRGNITPKFRYDLSGGWRMVKNQMVQTVFFSGLGTGSVPRDLVPGVIWTYQDSDGADARDFTKYSYNEAFVDFNGVYDAKPFLVEARLSYRWNNLLKNEKPGFGGAPFTGMVRGRYNWNDRIIGGLYVEMASARRGYLTPMPGTAYNPVEARIPGWVDLGLSGEYVINRHFSIWASAGNLLNMTIQRTPMYTSSGINFTLGLVFLL